MPALPYQLHGKAYSACVAQKHNSPAAETGRRTVYIPAFINFKAKRTHIRCRTKHNKLLPTKLPHQTQRAAVTGHGGRIRPPPQASSWLSDNYPHICPRIYPNICQHTDSTMPVMTTAAQSSFRPIFFSRKTSHPPRIVMIVQDCLRTVITITRLSA